MNSDICLILPVIHSHPSQLQHFSFYSCFCAVGILLMYNVAFWSMSLVGSSANMSSQFWPDGPRSEPGSVLSSVQWLGLSSPRWERRAYSVDHWFTKDRSLQVLHWPFSQGCLVQLFVSLAANFKPVSIFCRSKNDNLVPLRCMKHCHPHDHMCQHDLAHLITYTTLSLPTITDLTEPEGELWHRRKVRLSSHFMKAKANVSSFRYNLPADQYSIQNLSSIRCHRHLLRYHLHGCRVLVWGSKASSPGDDHR